MMSSMRRAAIGHAATIVAVSATSAAVAYAEVTPASGARWSSFEITFPAMHVGLEVDLYGPLGCRGLDSLYIPIRRASTGHFRFGPRVPGARPRRDGRKARRWCRGPDTVRVVYIPEFRVEGEEIASGRFTVS